MAETSGISFNAGINSGSLGINSKQDVDALSALTEEYSAGSFSINGTSFINSFQNELDDLQEVSQVSLSSMTLGGSVDNIKDAVSSIANKLGVSFNDAINMLKTTGGKNIDTDPLDKKNALHNSTPFDEMKNIQALYSRFEDEDEKKVDSTIISAINPTYQSTMVF
ncbi:MAG: hypothetical protein A2Y40_08415 [Candidatus Margulisbacteria bacterium GWF2_35_9]|nr:MAG: hypothetical protein A2Y40_08415 [Candidatus Margulisbacteria bacterium GWF2_35_9]